MGDKMELQVLFLPDDIKELIEGKVYPIMDGNGEVIGKTTLHINDRGEIVGNSVFFDLATYQRFYYNDKLFISVKLIGKGNGLLLKEDE